MLTPVDERPILRTTSSAGLSSGLAVVKALRFSLRSPTEDDIMTKSRKRSPRHLSDTSLILLGRAADSEDQMLLPIPKIEKAHGKALERALAS